MRQNWQLYKRNIAPDVVQNIIDQAGETTKAGTFNNADDSIRSSRVCWLTNEDWLKDLLFQYVDHSCQNAFYVNVFKNAEIQYTEYHASENGHYDWHHDIDWNANDGLDRKLSITVQLSDINEYEGGDFQFTEVPNPEMKDAKQKGTVLIFPSYLIHQVSPVTKGVRKSLVAWFKGPKWQ
jgi:PKHD-type hydroxylase